MDSNQLRNEAQRMIAATIPDPDAIWFTFMRIIAMIEREGFQIPKDGLEFLWHGGALERA
jgi:hypothetical protein